MHTTVQFIHSAIISSLNGYNDSALPGVNVQDLKSRFFKQH